MITSLAIPLDGLHVQNACYHGSGDPNLNYLCVYHYSGRANQIQLFHKVM